MGRAVVFTYPDPSHVNSSLPVFAELVRRGEDVTIYSSTAYRDVIESAGASFRSYYGVMSASSTGPLGGLKRRLDFAEQVLPHLIEALSADRPDYVLLDAAANWGSVLAGFLQIPAISYRLTVALHREMLDAAEMVRRFYSNTPQEFALQGMLDAVGYYEAAQRIDRQYEAHTGDIPASLECRCDLNLVMIPRALQMEVDRFDQSYRFVGPCLGAREELDEFDWNQLGTDPLIYISLGTVFNHRPEFFRTCMVAFDEVPVQVVMSVGRRIDPADLGPAPKNVLVTQFVKAPIAKMLERASLVIHHAGGNTVQECARAAVPQLMYPQAGDQFALADLVQQYGAGIRLNEGDITATRIRELAAEIMSNPEYRSAAIALSALVRDSGGTAQACDEILRFALDKVQRPLPALK